MTPTPRFPDTAWQAPWHSHGRCSNLQVWASALTVAGPGCWQERLSLAAHHWPGLLPAAVGTLQHRTARTTWGRASHVATYHPPSVCPPRPPVKVCRMGNRGSQQRTCCTWHLCAPTDSEAQHVTLWTQLQECSRRLLSSTHVPRCSAVTNGSQNPPFLPSPRHPGHSVSAGAAAVHCRHPCTAQTGGGALCHPAPPHVCGAPPVPTA